MYVTKQIQNNLLKRKANIHQRSIFRQMMNTCDKLQNSFLSRRELRRFEQKEKEEFVQTRRTDVIDRQHAFQRRSHDPFSSIKDKIFEDFVYVKESRQIKQIKDLKQKMMPKVNKNNIQKKLKEITNIRNMGYNRNNKRLQSFKTLTREQDQQNTINKSWETFYHDKSCLTPTQTPLPQQKKSSRRGNKKSTYYLSSKIHEGKQKEIRQKALNASFTPSLFLQAHQNFCETSQSKTLETSFTTKFTDLTSLDLHKNDNHILKVSKKKKTLREAIQSISRGIKSVKTSPNTKRYPLSCGRRKQMTQKIGLNKQKLSKENAFGLYKLIKGGYERDRNDIQGEYISLKRFKQAKDNFMILNTCFNKIQQERYIVQQPQKIFNDGSFRSLVYLTEMENKISSWTFKDVQKLNGVVD